MALALRLGSFHSDVDFGLTPHLCKLSWVRARCRDRAIPPELLHERGERTARAGEGEGKGRRRGATPPPTIGSAGCPAAPNSPCFPFPAPSFPLAPTSPPPSLLPLAPPQPLLRRSDDLCGNLPHQEQTLIGRRRVRFEAHQWVRRRLGLGHAPDAKEFVAPPPRGGAAGGAPISCDTPSRFSRPPRNT